MAMARPNTKEKRRADLVDAALTAAARLGLRAISMTEVAKAAGLTRGALLYYFDDLDALLVEAHKVGTQRFCDEREALIAAESDPRQQLWIAIDSGLPSGPDDALMRLLYDFDVLAGTSPMHDELVQKMYRRQAAIYRGVLESGVASGDFVLTSELDEIVMNFVALEDAYGLHIVAGNSLITVDLARKAMRGFAGQAGASSS